MRKKLVYRFLIVLVNCFMYLGANAQERAWIRINQLGYLPDRSKVAVWVSKGNQNIQQFQLIDVQSKQVVYAQSSGKVFGQYGPFQKGYRLDFSAFKTSGEYYILSDDGTKSPTFKINSKVYDGAADFTLRYMRQQRTLFNPFLQDSCHTHDGFTMYAGEVGIPDSTRIDVAGGWHDASDYLQYATTSANATFHLLAAYRDFPSIFQDLHQANGLSGKNNIPDILDEAKWGLDWLLKMYPKSNLMFNQIADDRDHTRLRMPGQDSLYGRGHERPVYFIDGKPQQRGKFLNNTTGTSSTAAKFVSAFGLGYQLYQEKDILFANLLKKKAKTAYQFAYIRPGVTQTVSVKSPYIYAEDNWVDDMELAEASMFNLSQKPKHLKKAIHYARQETVTPWMIRDTANHYQYYPFINLGHYELAKIAPSKEKEELINYYRQGIDQVWNRAKENVFYRGVPFVWCSNNLTTSFAIQCYWYRNLTGDQSYATLEQANIDWLFGLNPWGTSMVYGFPSYGDTPVDPHSAFTYLHGYPIDGGLVDGPVYASIYNNLIGIKLNNPDEYAEFQSDLVVYHDDFGDYSSNEPTMDGTASLIYLLSAQEFEAKKGQQELDGYGAIIRGDREKKQVSLLFTGDEFHEGLAPIRKVLNQEQVKASFFVTGRLLADTEASDLIQKLHKEGHRIGPHSDQHLLYAPWDNRDSLFVTEVDFKEDLKQNVAKLTALGIQDINQFVAPYEWYNQQIQQWSAELGLTLYNFTPGLRTAADYTYPEMGSRYMSSSAILKQLMDFDKKAGLNGQIIIVHLGADPRRKDKFFNQLEKMIKKLKNKNYRFVLLNEL